MSNKINAYLLTCIANILNESRKLKEALQEPLSSGNRNNTNGIEGFIKGLEIYVIEFYMKTIIENEKEKICISSISSALDYTAAA